MTTTAAPATVHALIYTRVSSDEQARDGVSLEAQLAECRRYSARPSWLIDREFKDILSGSRDDRPDYLRLLARARHLRAEVRRVAVVVAKLDRFGRRVLERVRCREELKSLGVPTHSVREGGEVPDLLANILASVAQEEVRQLGERVRASWTHITGKGWHKVGSVRWGYLLRDATEDERRQGAPRKVLDVDPATAPFVREAFRRAVAGETIRSVARWIASLPDEARGGRTLGYSAVRTLLLEPAYIARRERDDGGDVLEGEPQRWPALIDDATWAEVGQRIVGHQKMPRQASGKYLLTGLIRCPRCGGRMSGRPARPDGRLAAGYRCQGQQVASCQATAPVKAIDELVMAEVSSVVQTAASDDRRVRASIRRAWGALQQPTGDDALTARRIRGLEQDATKARERLARAAVKLVDGELDKAGYELARDLAQADLAQAERALAELAPAEPPAPALPPLDEVLAQLGGWAEALGSADVPSRREVLGTLIDQVVPERVGYGQYEARITWSPLGEALRDVGAEASAA